MALCPLSEDKELQRPEDTGKRVETCCQRLSLSVLVFTLLCPATPMEH